MPPAISDDEKSDFGDLVVPTPSKRIVSDLDGADDDEMLDVVGKDEDDADDAADENGEDEDDEDLDEDEYIVEKILAHNLEADGTLKYKVKWEGYEKKADQTWEDEDNLKENATQVLEEYLESVGGRDKIIEESQTALKSKKRGRPSAGSAAVNGTKRRRNESHPDSATPPASATKAWKPPAGSWEDDVESIDACQDEQTGKLVVYLTWKNGRKTQHDTKVIYQRCPQKMLHFYERHVKVVMANGETLLKDEK
ncbi:hypothetical protein F5Y16DRAFT_381284 [Xylariaceae sp. FL0255]|nr:hypothetical protein F5Y16DRAFT_381284 [Xylariaceae sp. FL0255]